MSLKHHPILNIRKWTAIKLELARSQWLASQAEQYLKRKGHNKLHMMHYAMVTRKGHALG
jgi:hypothetical protein